MNYCMSRPEGSDLQAIFDSILFTDILTLDVLTLFFYKHSFMPPYFGAAYNLFVW